MNWLAVLQACVPILVALVGIIPTIVSNRKKTDEALKTTQASIQKLQNTLNAHIKEDENEKARNQRYRILRFYDEVCAGQKHSESHYEDILDDISEYEQYCARHPDFKNSRGVIAMQEIEQTYKKIKSKGGFLIRGETA